MLTDFAEIWWLVCNLKSQCWRRISLKSDVVCQSYGNVYRGTVFFVDTVYIWRIFSCLLAWWKHITLFVSKICQDKFDKVVFVSRSLSSVELRCEVPRFTCMHWVSALSMLFETVRVRSVINERSRRDRRRLIVLSAGFAVALTYMSGPCDRRRTLNFRGRWRLRLRRRGSPLHVSFPWRLQDADAESNKRRWWSFSARLISLSRSVMSIFLIESLKHRLPKLFFASDWSGWLISEA